MTEIILIFLQILPLENKMKTPQDFGGCFGVLNISMFIVGLLYIAVGFFGYLKYGDAAVGSVTLNLPQGEWSVFKHSKLK